MLGGCCSLIAIILIIAIFILQLADIFMDFNYDSSEEQSFIKYSENHEPLMISTDEVIPAIQLLSFEENNQTLDIANYVVATQSSLKSVKTAEGFDVTHNYTSLKPC